MQDPGIASSAPNYATYPATRRKPAYLAGILFPLIVLALIGGSLYWLQEAGQIGITQGYPTPTVHIQPLSSGKITLLKSTTFSAQASGRDLTYSWNFGDVQTDPNASSSGPTKKNNYTGQSVSYAYTNNGSHTITVFVKDGSGQTSTATYTVNVLPPPPIAHFTYTITNDYYGFGSAQFDFSSSSADPSTSIQSYYIDYGDGQSDTLTYFYGAQYHSYAAAGTYKVTLTVTDGYNQQASFSDTVNIAAQ